jgi:HK97 gp10 family phage protein
MKVSMEITGAEQLSKELQSFGINAKKELQRIVAGAALNIQAEIKRSIQQSPGTGRIYEKYQPRRTHKASSPGNPPRTDTGRLVNSITIQQSDDKLSAVVYSPVKYALYLEFGTTQTEARPFFGPALLKERPKFEAALDKIVDAAARGIG